MDMSQGVYTGLAIPEKAASPILLASFDSSVTPAEVARIDLAAKGHRLLTDFNAGHGLNYTNVKKVAAIGGIEEFNIGHSIISRAVLVGLDRAVRDMVELIKYA